MNHDALIQCCYSSEQSYRVLSLLELTIRFRAGLLDAVDLVSAIRIPGILLDYSSRWNDLFIILYLC